MCNVSGKLIAWMDGELLENEAADVEHHVGKCSECRRLIEAYGEVSRLVVTYCHAVSGARASRKVPRWIPALAGAVAVAALLLFTFRPAAVKSIPIVARSVAPAPVVAPKAVPAPTKVHTKAVHRHPESVARRTSNPEWAFANPAFQIVLPADAMFAPGAMPEGAIFRADLSMASDGSVQGLRLLQ